MNANYRRQQFFLKNSLRGSSLVQILIYANLILFTLMVLHGTVRGLGMQAILNPPIDLMVHWGGQYWPWVLQHGEWWRCITYAFTHGGLIHLGFNMVVLYQVGPLLEAEIGWSRLLSVYTFSTIIATLAGLFWHPVSVVVGASGAIFGLIGLSVSFYHRVGGAIGLQRRNFMFQWALMAFIFGLRRRRRQRGTPRRCGCRGTAWLDHAGQYSQPAQNRRTVQEPGTGLPGPDRYQYRDDPGILAERMRSGYGT